MKKNICAVLAVLLLAGCGNASAAVAESTASAEATSSAASSTEAATEATPEATKTPEPTKSAEAAIEPSASPSASVEASAETETTDTKAAEEDTSSSQTNNSGTADNNTINPDEQGYWDANGNWIGYGWWNDEGYHYDTTYHTANDNSAAASADQQTQTQAQQPVQNYGSVDINAIAAAYNGQYAGVGCENLANQYLGFNLLEASGYQVYDPQPNDVIAYFDSGWNYRHTAVYLGNGYALHGNYGSVGSKCAMVASASQPWYPNVVYFRVGGGTPYPQFVNDVAHAYGGNAGWMENQTTIKRYSSDEEFRAENAAETERQLLEMINGQNN